MCGMQNITIKKNIMSNKVFHGSFIFRNHGHGILSSTYFNTSSPKPYPETAILVENENNKDPFLGKFETIWLDAGSHVKGYLTIRPHPNYALGYHLEWSESPNDKVLAWEGIGNMEVDLLFGCYWRIK